jgi:hypothetical protein
MSITTGNGSSRDKKGVIRFTRMTPFFDAEVKKESVKDRRLESFSLPKHSKGQHGTA